MGEFGKLIKECRLSSGLSLREFCLKNGFDAGNHSKLERGLFAPPENDDRVEVYAKALELEEGTDKWMSLFDAAAAERGRFPTDLMSDKQVVSKLPVLFRTLRSERKSGNFDLDEFVERIKQS